MTLEEVGTPLKFKWGKCKLATCSIRSWNYNYTITSWQKPYSIISNGGYDIKPTLILKESDEKYRDINKSFQITMFLKKVNLAILRKIVTTRKREQLALPILDGYEVGRQNRYRSIKSIQGGYSNK